MARNKKKVAVAAPKARKPKRDAEEKKFAKKADMTEFRAQLDSLGLKIIELEGNEEEHMKYRAMIVQYIKEHRVDFEPFIEDEEPFEKYCDSMLEDGTWAGHMELQAASILKRKNICIHMLNSPRWYIRNFSDREATSMIHLSYHQGEHYNSVRLREDPCQGPAMPVIIKADANVASTSNNAQTKAKDLKKSSDRSKYDHISVKLVMAGTGCSNIAAVEQVLKDMDGDIDAAIEYMLAEQLILGSDDADGDPYLDYACDAEYVQTIEDELSMKQDESQLDEHKKEEKDCSSKGETAQKHNSSHSKKGKSKTKECSCGSARKHKPSCNLATTVASREPPKTTAPSREPPKYGFIMVLLKIWRHIFDLISVIFFPFGLLPFFYTPMTKGGQGKGQKGKKQKKKEQDETPAIRDHDSKVAPDLGALCI
ncbi:OVARIAN TUMOR DOMAIN-containing deubiquitinating enzyme 7 isoform X3 [Oryza sativa Japonica Group]|uniref:OVARIAN TUMOR DOMAIN-containing deubiquitinating enzyme 7 isoform X3 n=1 Tax=Oryza sativa subsp. japonica TaxID=39947 RepID=UPI00339C037C